MRCASHLRRTEYVPSSQAAVFGLNLVQSVQQNILYYQRIKVSLTGSSVQQIYFVVYVENTKHVISMSTQGHLRKTKEKAKQLIR